MHSIVISLISFTLALIILITVHEFGHFWVARRLGVKVLKFSLGFGKKLFGFRDRSGTEYVVSIFPLGGYVKMLDEREGEVADEEKHRAFNRQSLSVRSAIVVAGPLFNVLFAIVAYWGMYVLGVQSLKAIVGEVAPQSIAAQAGIKPNDVITSVNHAATANWQQVRLELVAAIGDKSPLPIQVTPLSGGKPEMRQLNIDNWQVDKQIPNPVASLGLSIKIPSIPAIVGHVLPGKPGDLAGLKPGDRLVSINQIALKDWNQFVKYIRVRPQQELQLEVERGNERLKFKIKPERLKAKNGKEYGLIGVRSQSVSWPENMISHQKYSIFSAWWPALTKLYDMTLLTFVMIGKLLFGKLSIQSISGPVGIAVGAGQSAQISLAYYLNFLGLVSISLAVLNILPLPILDGGHLLYFLIEWLKGKPVSKQTELFGMKIGIILLLTLMVIALYNDVTRLIG